MTGNKKTKSTGGFTLIELLIVIATVAILAVSVIPALARTKERTRRIACLSNLKQIGKGAAIYAEDNHGVVFACKGVSGVYVPNALIEDPGSNISNKLKSVSLDLKKPSVWVCPSRTGSLTKLPYHETIGADQWIIGYAYFGCMTNWHIPIPYNFTLATTHSPIKLGTSKPYWCLATDTNVRGDPGSGPWGALTDLATGQPYWDNIPPHVDSGHIPAGGNEVFADGSAKWIPYRMMYALHSYTGSNGNRNWFWWQRFDDIPTNAIPPIGFNPAILHNLTALNPNWNN